MELEPEDAAELARRLRAAREDVVALVLVGLVRSGVVVGVGRLRGFFWARPLSADRRARARERLKRADEDGVLLRSAVKASDGFFTTFFVSPYSRHIARWCARRGLTPNQVTTFSMGLGILAAAGFATGERWGLIAGAVLLQAAFTFDCVDGQLARYTRTFSKLGAWLDSVFDRGKEYVVFAGLAIGGARAGLDPWVLACAALGLQTTRHFVDFSYPVMQQQAIATVTAPPLEEPGDGLTRGRPRWYTGATARARPASAPATPRPAKPLPLRALRAWRRAGRGRRATWAKKVLAFPIGERFAVISLTAAIFDAEVTFITMLAWGSVALAYVSAGRVLRSVRSRRAALGPREGDRRLEAFRDDGPLARALGTLAGRRVRAPTIALTGLGLLVLAGLIAATGDGAADGVLAAGVAAAVLLGGLTAARRHAGRLRWAVPSVLRATEFGGITWLAANAGARALPAGFGLLSAIAFRHYDNVYRQRQRGDEGVTTVETLGLGWDGRLLVTLAIVLLGLAPGGLWAVAGGLAVLFVGEAVHGWLTFNRTQGAPLLDDDEQEAE